MSRIQFTVLIFLIAYIAWHIPQLKTARDVPVKETFVSQYESDLPEATKGKNPYYVWHIPLPEKNAHETILLDKLGNHVKHFQLPSGLSSKKKSTVGYLAYPQNGEFFLWYPQLGRSIRFFDGDGRSIWERNESRYLSVSPAGKYLLAAAGDHSRVEFLNPNLDSLMDAEGVVFIKHQWYLDSKVKASETENDENWDAGVIFLDGIVRLFSFKKKISLKIQFSGIIRNAYIDLTNGAVLVQSEKEIKPNQYKDILIRTNPRPLNEVYSKENLEENLEKNKTVVIEEKADIRAEYVLSGYSPYLLPLIFNETMAAVILPSKPYNAENTAQRNHSGNLLVFKLNEKEPISFPIPPIIQNPDTGSWRIGKAADGFFTFSNELVFWFNETGINWIKEIPQMQRVDFRAKSVFMNSSKSAYVYSWH